MEKLNLNARKLARKYNLLDEDHPEEKMKILQELLSATEELPYLQAPVYFDYGCNTFFGKFSSANFNFTCLDVCQIHIGDNVTKILKNRFEIGTKIVKNSLDFLKKDPYNTF